VAADLGAREVAPGAIFDQPCDVFAPCALADAIDERSAPRLRCAIVAGSANNQLAEARLGRVLLERDILHVPDIVANAGGVMGAAGMAQLDALGPLLEVVLERAARDQLPPQEAAEQLARERFAALGGRP